MQFNYCADYIYAQRCYLEKSRGGGGSANQQLGVSQSARTAIQFGFHAMPLWKFQLSTADFGVAFARHNYSATRLFVFKRSIAILCSFFFQIYIRQQGKDTTCTATYTATLLQSRTFLLCRALLPGIFAPVSTYAWCRLNMKQC